MEKSVTNICPACHTKYQVIYYQRRAADEPPDKVTFCTNCPVNTSKLSLSIPRQDKEGDICKVKKKQSTLKQNQSYSNNETLSLAQHMTCMKIEGNAAQRCYKSLLDNAIKFTPIVGVTLPVRTSTSKKLVLLHLNSSFSGKAFATVDSCRIAPFVTLQKVEVFTHSLSIEDYMNKSIIGYEHNLESIIYVQNIVIRTIEGGKQPYIFLTINSASLSETICLSVLQQILIRYGTENTIKTFIDSSVISALYNQSARAFDWVSAPEEGYTYTWKPDGERFWYLKYGSIWIFCRRLLSGKITGWNVTASLIKSNKAGPILDVEVMIGHPPILIDVLALESGVPTRALRSLEDVLSTFHSMKSIDTPIHVRQYFKSESELILTKDKLNYPIDGIVGIEDRGMTIIKLKGIKSIELKLQIDGSLVSAEGIPVLESNLHNTYPTDSIIEVRFTRRSIEHEPEISETILRTDKTKANEYSVCQEVMRITSTMPDTLARRRVLLWCNSVRQRIHQFAAKSEGKGRVVLDIGAGDGQSVTDYSDSSDVTYILVESDKSKCNKLRRRLSEPGTGKHIYFDTSNQIGKAISSVSRGLVKYAIINASIEDILKQDNCIKMFKSCIRCCVASFSISHTLSSLITLALEGFNVIGCGYLYDGIQEGHYLVNEYGVVMKKETNVLASVKWGSDTTYNEAPIESKDFEGILFSRLATVVVPVVKDQETQLLDTITSTVYVISSRKRI